jgi:hypothetical protein
VARLRAYVNHWAGLSTGNGPDFAWDMSKFPWPEQQLYEGAEGAHAVSTRGGYSSP